MAKEEQIKTSIDLTGEKEYRAACTNINSSLREIGSEMKLTTAEFADNADTVLSGKDSIKNLRWLLTVLLNEGAADDEEPLTEKQVGKLIHTGNFADVKAAIFKSFSMGNNGTPEPPERDEEEEDDEEDIEKNATAGKE